MGYIYLIHLYPSNPDKIYKLGRTARDFIERFNEYRHTTTNPEIKFVYEINNIYKAEKELLVLFKSKFTLRTDMGNEYFTGNIEEMKKTLMKYFINFENESEDERNDENEDETYEINTYENYLKLSKYNI